MSIVVAAGEQSRLERVLRELARQDYPHERLSIIVLHAPGIDAMAVASAAQGIPVRAIECPRPHGPFAANRALREAGGDAAVNQ